LGKSKADQKTSVSVLFEALRSDLSPVSRTAGVSCQVSIVGRAAQTPAASGSGGAQFGPEDQTHLQACVRYYRIVLQITETHAIGPALVSSAAPLAGFHGQRPDFARNSTDSQIASARRSHFFGQRLSCVSTALRLKGIESAPIIFSR